MKDGVTRKYSNDHRANETWWSVLDDTAVSGVKVIGSSD